MKKNNKGVAIFITLMLLFMLSLVAIAVLLTAYNYNYICEKQIKRVQAIASLEAGLNYAYYNLRTDADFIIDHNSEVTADTYPDSPDLLINGLTVKIWAWQTGATPGKYTVRAKTTY
ncbi:MAG: hypothetical protein KKB22_00945 [Candidatus Omnitrophica bacterium]|nr:hypothetical protein [Candidatus Omnitrophota bacterium]